MPGRCYTGNGYRYGLNGKEKDDEVKGSGNAIEFGGRSIYDSRLARFISIDPRWREFTEWSPYHFGANNPIVFVDEDGEGPNTPLWAVNQPQEFTSGDTRDNTALFSWQVVKTQNDQAKGVWHAVTNPVETFRNLWHAATSPVQTTKAIGKSLNQSYEAVKSGDPKKMGEVGGQVIFAGSTMGGSVGAPSTGLTKLGIVNSVWTAEKLAKALNFLTKAEKLSEIAYGCEAVAMKVQKAIGGDFLQITPMRGRLLGTIDGEATNWAHHVAVLKDGKVFDKLTGNKGMALEEYKKMFDYADDLKFEAVKEITVK